MKLRTRLVLAFFLLAVLPLAGVTVYSYSSSLEAFRRAVAAEAGSLTEEMNRRMELVTADLSQRIDGLGDLPYRELAACDLEEDTAPAGRFLSGLLSHMGQAAMLVESLEFIPAGTVHHVPDARAAEVPVEPRRLGGFVINLAELMSSDAAEQGEDEELTLTEADEVIRFELGTASVQLPTDLLRAGLRFAASAAEQEDLAELMELVSSEAGIEGWVNEIEARVQHKVAVAREQADSERSVIAERVQTMTITPEPVAAPGEQDFECAVHRDGELVGHVKAQLNTGVVLRSVLSQTRRDQGEIPFAIDGEGRLHTLDDASDAALQDLPLLAAGALGGSAPAAPSGNWVIVTEDDPELGVTFGIARPVGDSLKEIRNAAGRNLSYGLVLVAVAMFGIVPLSGRMTRNLSALTQGASKLAGGELEARVPVRSSDEFGELSRAFNRMAHELKENQTRLVREERLQKELEMSRQIQIEMLPRGRRSFPFAEVRAVSIPAREVGGDFFNYFSLPDGSVALLIGDVSGKGVPAALTMANLQATLRARLPLESDLSSLAKRLDREIDETTRPETYLTLFVAILDLNRKRLRYVNAGHNTQYLLTHDGEIDRLASGGRPLGLFPGGDYAERAVPVGHGDSLFLFTDGLVEAENPAGEAFGEERIETMLKEHGRSDPDAILARAEQAVARHRHGVEAADDATMLVLRIGDIGAAGSSGVG